MIQTSYIQTENSILLIQDCLIKYKVFVLSFTNKKLLKVLKNFFIRNILLEKDKFLDRPD